MPPKAKVAKVKAKRRKPANTRVNDEELFLFDPNDVKAVPIDSIHPHPANPKIGNVREIANSLRRRKMYRPIVVNQNTGDIVAGNHTWKAAKHLEWPRIMAVFLDLTDEEAEEILIADNSLPDLGTYNQKALAEILERRRKDNPDLIGMGYDPGTVDMIINAAKSSTTLSDDILRVRPALMDDEEEGETGDTNTTGAGDPVFGDEAEEPSKDELAEASDELGGIFQINPETRFLPGTGFLQFPKLRADMLLTRDELPWPLESWAGSATKDWPDKDQWWFYNFGIDSTSGMHDVSKMVLAFYCFDEYFENWWYYPDRFIGKMLNSKIKYAVMPDFSPYGSDPRIQSAYNIYKNLWLARMMQEAGIRVIPNVTWRYNDDEFVDQIVIPTLPVGASILSLQLQTFEKNQPKEEFNHLKAIIRRIFKTLKPDNILLYSGHQGHKFMNDLRLGPNILFVENRLVKLTAQAKNRKKKKTL